MLREAVRKGTETGKLAKEYMEAGLLVPDEVTLGVFFERINKDDCKKGYILDGIPRNLAQAKELEKMGLKIDAALLIEISDEEIEHRLTGRRLCPECQTPYHLEWQAPKKEGICDSCGAALFRRPDDEPETVRKRLAEYHRETAPLAKHYGDLGCLITVKNIHGVQETTDAILKALGIDCD